MPGCCGSKPSVDDGENGGQQKQGQSSLTTETSLDSEARVSSSVESKSVSAIAAAAKESESKSNTSDSAAEKKNLQQQQSTSGPASLSSSGGQYTRTNVENLSESEFSRFVTALAAFQKSDLWQSMCALHGGGHRFSTLESIGRLAEKEAGAKVQDVANHVFCEHGRKLFAMWHRPFLLEFELVLQTFDPLGKGHGSPDSLALPYFDWIDGFTKLPDRVTRAKVTAVDGTEIDNPLASGPARPTPAEARDGVGPTRKTVRFQQRSFPSYAADCARMLADDDYYRIASNGDMNPVNIERPHDSIHGIVGGFQWNQDNSEMVNGDMSRILYSSWDPIFWLHHNCVEKLHYTWIALHPTGRHTVTRADRQEPLWPFAERDKFVDMRSWEHSGKPSTLDDWFDNNQLPYKYDSLPRAPAPTARLDQAMRVGHRRRHVVRLIGVQETVHSGDLQVFVTPAGQPMPAFQPGTDPATIKEFAGSVPMFVVGSEEHVECTGCRKRARELFGGRNYALDCTEFLARNQIQVNDPVTVHVRLVDFDLRNQYDVDLKAAEITFDGDLVGLPASTQFAAPGDADLLQRGTDRLKIARFMLSENWIESTGGGDDNESFVRAMAAAFDSNGSSSALAKAVVQVQERFASTNVFSGLLADGAWGPKTSKLFRAAHCHHTGPSARHSPSKKNEPHPALIQRLVKGVTADQPITVAVTGLDSDDDAAAVGLTRQQAGQTAVDALAWWGQLLGGDDNSPDTAPLSSVQLVSAADLAVVILNFNYIDGPGNVIAWTHELGDGRVTVYAEKWRRWDSTLLLRVLRHEIGHCLGLGHSLDRASLMFPYSSDDDGSVELAAAAATEPSATQDDIKAVRDLLKSVRGGIELKATGDL